MRSEFAVLGGLPTEYAQGVFAKQRTYSSIIRYSNGSGQSQDDRTGDGRGMAIKLLDVDGEKLLTDEVSARTQDFLMINHPVFFVRTAEDYVDFQQAASSGTVALLWWIGRHIFHEGWIINQIRKHVVTNPLNSRYWSMTASKVLARRSPPLAAWGVARGVEGGRECGSNRTETPFST